MFTFGSYDPDGSVIKRTGTFTEEKPLMGLWGYTTLTDYRQNTIDKITALGIIKFDLAACEVPVEPVEPEEPTDPILPP